MEWKWTNGQPYERSKRLRQEDNTPIVCKYMNESAYTSSLNHDENTWDMLNQQFANSKGSGSGSGSKRDEIETKLSGREMMQQIGCNPFLNNHSYVDNITMQNKYMKPMNTTTTDIE